MVYKKAHKPARRKVDHPSAKIWDVDDLSSGDESHSEGPPMSSRSHIRENHHSQWMAYLVSANLFLSNSFSSSS